MAEEAGYDKEQGRSRGHLLDENRRLAQRCLELESAARRQLERLQAANAALSRGEADLRVLLENSAIGFALIDTNLRVASANKTMADILGFEQKDLPGVNFGSFIYVGKLPAFTRLTSRFTAGRGKSDEIIELVARDGGLIPCRLSVSDWLDDLGALRGHFLLVFDAGPELIAAGRLREMERSMAEAERSKALFLEVVSRELRSPAGGIMGMARMLMDSDLDERQAELAGVIHSSASSLVRLIDDLMDVASADPAEAVTALAPVSPAGFARSVANMFGVRAEEKGLELRVHVSGSVPEHVMADPGFLNRVLAHLLDNSLKFTERGHIALSVDTVGDRLRFMVSDTGKGIDPDVVGDPLSAGLNHDSADSRRHGGIGIGLAICGRLVGLMGGRLSYESEPGRGSEFHFSIPLTPVADSAAEVAMEPPPEAVHLPPMAILLADANPLNAKAIRAYLNFDGHSLVVAENGVEAAEKCRDNIFDLAILDSNLPKLDGLQTLRLIRESERTRPGRRLPVLFLASPGQMRKEEYYLRAGADGVIRKPVQPVELMTVIAAATGAKPLSVARRGPPARYDARAGGSSLRRIDGAQLVNLRQVMLADQFTGMLRFFMEDAVPGLIDLGGMAEQAEPDHERIALAASKAGGLASYLGFSALADLLKRMEKAGRAGAPADELRRLAGELPMVTDDSLEELKRIIPEAFATISDMHENPGGDEEEE